MLNDDGNGMCIAGIQWSAPCTVLDLFVANHSGDCQLACENKNEVKLRIQICTPRIQNIYRLSRTFLLQSSIYEEIIPTIR